MGVHDLIRKNESGLYDYWFKSESKVDFWPFDNIISLASPGAGIDGTTLGVQKQLNPDGISLVVRNSWGRYCPVVSLK